MKNYKAGDTVTFTLYRSGETLTVDITLDENDMERSQAMQGLQESYNEAQNQQSQQQQGNVYSWPFGSFNW